MTKILTQEMILRNAIRQILSESAFPLFMIAAAHAPEEEYIKHEYLEKKFSLVEEGEPDFVVIADSIVDKKSIIVAYSQTTKSIKEIAEKLIGGKVIMPASKYEKAQYSDDIYDYVYKSIDEDDTWKVSKTAIIGLKNQFTSPLMTNFTDYAIIDRIKSNFKKPRIASTKYGIEAASKGECVLELDETVSNIFSKNLDSPDWSLAAACFYSYANSVSVSIFAAALGGVIGSLGGPAGATAGAIIATSSIDIFLRLPVLLWAGHNKRWGFFVANLIYVAMSIVGGGLQLKLIKNPKVLSKIAQAAYWVFELIIQFLPDLAANREKIKIDIMSMMENPEQVDAELKKSSDEIKALLSGKYPRF